MPRVPKNISHIHLRHRHIGTIGFGVVTYRAGGRFGPRRQQDFQLVVVHRGEATITIDGRTTFLAAGDGILLGPGSEEWFRFSERKPTTHSWCQIPPDAIPAGMVPSGVGKVARCRSWLRKFMAEAWRIPPEPAGMMKGFVLGAIWAFSRGGSGGRPIPEALRRAQQVMADHVGDPLTLDEIARAAGVSRGHLIKLAREHWGATPMESLWSLRIDHGARLLRETGLGIGEVAYSVGFANPFHFSRRFKARFGQSPRAWRAAAWSG